MARSQPKDTAEPDEAGKVTTRQMRHMMALLREHGVTGDATVHEYLATAVAEMDHEPPESLRDLSTVLAAHIIAELESEPPRADPHGPKPSQLAALRKPFEDAAIGKLPRSTCKDCSDNRGTCSRHPNKRLCRECGNYHSDATMHIDYVGHADVTARLLEVDPMWSWRPWSPEELTSLNPQMRDAGLWIWLRVLGIERAGFGDADGKRGGNAVKEMIGDALRNAAMRFGVALDLWAKGDRDWAHAEKDGAETLHPDAPPPREQQGEQRADPIVVTAEEVLGQLESYRQRIVDDPPDNPRPTWEQFSAKFRQAHGGIPVEDLPKMPVERLMEWEASVRHWLDNPQPGQPATT